MRLPPLPVSIICLRERMESVAVSTAAASCFRAARLSGLPCRFHLYARTDLYGVWPVNLEHESLLNHRLDNSTRCR